MKKQGLLQVVGTPIGNLSDMSERARKALVEADVVACEDTRRCGQLYRLLGIQAPKMVSCYKENEAGRVRQVVEFLQQGQRVVLVSDGGMPGVSDPGAKVVAAVRKAGGLVEVIPGPSAVTAAVAGSGFEGAFVFMGFPERKTAALRRQLGGVRREERTLVFFESPQRVVDTLEAVREVLGNREAWLARELTKMHEEWLGPDVEEILATLNARSEVKGECVLVVKGAENVEEGIEVGDDEIVARLGKGESVKDVAAWLAEVTGESKKTAYARVLEVRAGLAE